MIGKASALKDLKCISCVRKQIYAGNEKQLIKPVFGKNAVLLDKKETDVLTLFSLPAAPKEVLSAERRNNTGFVPRRDYYRIIGKLFDNGLLLPLNQFEERLRRSNCTSTPFSLEKPPTAPDNFCWISADRPDSITAQLKSFINNFKRYGRKPVLRVFNDSRDSRSDKRYAERINSLSSQYDGAVRYSGTYEKHVFSEKLKQGVRSCGIPPSVIDFLLGIGFEDQMTVGANRNAVLLDTINDRIVCCHDDVYCRLSNTPETPPEARVIRRHDPFNVSYYESRHQCIDVNQEMEGDFLNLHAALGSAFHDFIEYHRDSLPLNLEETDSSILSLLVSPACKLYLTAGGHYGDPAFSGNRPLLNSHGTERSKILADNASYEKYLYSFASKCDTDHYFICPGGSFFGNCFGLDNREPLVPFFPFGRNEESIFSRVLSLVSPVLLPLYLPYAVLHWGDDAKSYRREDLLSIAPEISSFILFFIGEYKQDIFTDIVETTANCYSGIGFHLKSIGTLSRNAFIEYAAHAYRTLLGSNLFYYKGLLFHYGNKPDYWAHDLSQLIEATEEAFFSDALPLPAELRTKNDPDRALEYFQHCIKTYGELLLCWPDIRKAASALKQRGVHLSSTFAGGT